LRALRGLEEQEATVVAQLGYYIGRATPRTEQL
jgi:hypothetical protein